MSDVAAENLTDCINLANFILPSVKKTIISQRGGEYGFGTKPSEFPVEKQANNIVFGINSTNVNYQGPK